MDILVFGLTLSLMYGLVAAGFALILGTSRIFDLCFGSYYLISAYCYYVCYRPFGKFLALGISVVVAVIFASAIHRFVLYHFRHTPIVVMVVSTALAIAIAECMTLLFGSDYKYIPALWEGSTELFGASMAYQRILAGAVSLATLGLLWMYLNKTKSGLAIRALIQKPEAAQLVGIRPRAIHLSVACIGAGLAALSSIMVVPVFSLSPHIWLDAILLSFAGVVVGGMGSIGGALVAMFVIAYAETLVSFTIPEGGFFRQAVFVLIMVLVLLFKPFGFFGKKEEA
jgi:branched-chain amino acid transport system permease protein